MKIIFSSLNKCNIYSQISMLKYIFNVFIGYHKHTKCNRVILLNLPDAVKVPIAQVNGLTVPASLTFTMLNICIILPHTDIGVVVLWNHSRFNINMVWNIICTVSLINRYKIICYAFAIEFAIFLLTDNIYSTQEGNQLIAMPNMRAK